MIASELQAALQALLPIAHADVRIGPGRETDLEEGTLVLVRDREGALYAYVRGACFDEEGKLMGSAINDWLIVPAHARTESAWIHAVLSVWPESVRCFIEETPLDDHIYFSTPAFFEPNGAFEGEPTTQPEELLRRLRASYANALQNCGAAFDEPHD
jgi:hypothetical protein